MSRCSTSAPRHPSALAVALLVFSASTAWAAGPVVGWGDGSTPPGLDGRDGAVSRVANGSHVCAIRAGTGEVFCSNHLSLDDDSISPPDAVNGVAGTAIDIAVSSHLPAGDGTHVSTCAIQAETGEVVCWGGVNSFTSDTPVPDEVNGVAGTASDIALASNFACATQAETGNVVCWGREHGFRDGLREPPDAVSGVAGTAIQLSAGSDIVCAIQAGTGKVVCWGGWGCGTLLVPEEIDGVPLTATRVEVGYTYTCAIQTGQAVPVCWGLACDVDEDEVQVFRWEVPTSEISLGRNAACFIHPDTRAVSCETPPLEYTFNVVADTVNAEGPSSTVVAGHSHACAIQDGTGRLSCWGASSVGQATPPSAVNGREGIAEKIVVDQDRSCAIQAGTGHLLCWGRSYGRSVPDAVNGVDGTAADVALSFRLDCAIQKESGRIVCWTGSSVEFGPLEVEGLEITATAVSGGWEGSLCAIQSGTGDVVCSGQLSDVPDELAAEGAATALAAYGHYACAIQAETDHVICWGGYGVFQVHPVPAAVNGVAGSASAISVGVDSACAIQSESGEVVCWGLGLDSDDVPNAVNGVAGTASHISLGADARTACAIQRETQEAVCWRKSRSEGISPPRELGKLSQLAVGDDHVLAILAPEPNAGLLQVGALVGVAGLWRRRTVQERLAERHLTSAA